jgi:hypothetical protein
LYAWNIPKSFKKRYKKNKLKTVQPDEEEKFDEPIPLMSGMGFKSLYYDYLCCFCSRIMKRPKFWIDYKKTLSMVSDDMNT